MMRKLLLLLPLLALASCSYPSKYEAEAACDEWARKGGKYIYVRYKDNQTSLAGKYLAGEITPDEYLQSPKYTEDKYRIEDGHPNELWYEQYSEYLYKELK